MAISRRIHVRRAGRVLGSTIGALLAGAASAGPVDGTVRAGTATITTAGASTTITQTTDRAVIDWRSFNIAPGESVAFAQPGAQSAVLNRVTGGQFSSLQGSLAANGQVYLVNPNGILIGGGATINAASFVASTASISTPHFMAAPVAANGQYTYNELTGAARSGTIVNAGTITVADGGLVALVAPAVKNSGTITARLGTIELASANIFTLDLFGDDLVRLGVSDSIASQLTDVEGNHVSALINSGGQLTADGGRIVLLAVPTAAAVVDEAINLSGVVQARTVAAGNKGEIILLANDGVVTISGAADASAPGAGLVGGDISIVGRTVQVGGLARLSASGAGGGGLVVLGGKYAAGDTTATDQTTVDAGAVVSACGTVNCAADGTGGTGAGGEIRLYSEHGTHLAGELNISSSADARTGTVELISNQGVAELAPTARIIALTGVGQSAGFAAVLGETISISFDATIDMRDVTGLTPDGTSRLVERYGVDPLDPDRRTEQPVLFHAYAANGNSGYDDPLLLPNVFNAIDNPGGQIFAVGRETPVGTLRPNGGAPNTSFANAADALTAIPVSFVPPPPAGSDVIGTQVSDTASRLARGDNSDSQAAGESMSADVNDTGSMLLFVGGPGVAAVADLGRDGSTTGASPDVFGVNFHVLAPAGDRSDAQVTDYLCRTQFARNGCAHGAPNK